MTRVTGAWVAVVASAAALLGGAGPADAVRDEPAATVVRGAAPSASTRVVRPQLRLSAPAARTLAVGKTVKIKVTVKNRGRVNARRTVVRLAAPAGARVSKKRLKLGALRPGAKRTRAVKVRLTKPARKAVRITATAAKAKKAQRNLVLRPAATRWKGNFDTPTDSGITFALSGNRRTITAFRAVQVTAYCYYGGWPSPYYPTLSLARIPVAANGAFDRTVKVPATAADQFPKTIRVRGKVTGNRISNGQLAMSARFEGTEPATTCSLYDSAKTWTAAAR